MFKKTQNSIETLFPIKSMQAIVDNISILIHHDVVICDQQGSIIAATQKGRIGVENENVRHMIQTGQEIYIIDKDDSDNNFLPGINLPIRYEGNSIGAVGITGEPEEVRVFCRIVQSFVQQQLTELTRERNRAIQKQVLNNFVYSWVFRDIYQDSDEFEIRSHSLGVDTHLPRMACVVNCNYSNTLNADTDSFQNNVQNFIDKYLKPYSDQHIVATLGNETVILLDCTKAATAKTLMQGVQEAVRTAFGVRVAVGIGSLAKSRSSVNLSYKAARHACEASHNSANNEIVVFELFDLELLVSNLDSRYRQQTYNYTFRKFKSNAQIEESIRVLQCYIDSNRSISKTAEALFLHKNTVQFRLNKIHELTGYDPRNTKDLTFLHAIALIHKIGTRKAVETSL